jgi:hypothetical protein
MISGLIVSALLVTMFPLNAVEAHEIDEPAFERTWERTDRPVSEGLVNRTWMWGPEGHTPQMKEEYADAPDGERLVQYFDKTRMEINDPAADQSSIWYVTNGLLAIELITGEMQVGDNEFEQRQPAAIHIAGDADPTSPTYATFNALRHEPPRPEGETIIQTVDKAGRVGEDTSLGAYGVSAEYAVEETSHTVASVFWDFMNSEGLIYEGGETRTDRLFENPFFAVGLPITEAYWMNVPVAGQPQDVLAQCFERRCLTYTPGNAEGWQVEAANIGQHYYEWRYNETPIDPSPPDDPPAAPGAGARDNPIPMGETVAFSDHWEVTVTSVIPDATQMVLNENQFNDPPAPGHQFFITQVEATYTGPDYDRFDGRFRLRSVGREAVTYRTFSDRCGVIPNEIDNPDTYTGGTISGNVCWQIRSGDAENLVMFNDDADEGEREYMALYHGPAVPTPEPGAPPSGPLAPSEGTRENPVPMSTWVDFGDGWHVRAVAATPEATQEVLDENQFNDPPESGNQFFIAEIEAMYFGTGSDRFDGTFRLRAVGSESVTYSTFSDRCGVTPNELDNPEVFPGGAIRGNVCWQVRSADAVSLVMFDDAFHTDGDRIYMSLH